MSTLIYSASNKTKQGFTLLELMIAVAIIGIMAAVAVPTYRNYVYKARAAALIMNAAPYIAQVNEKAMVSGALGNYAAVTKTNFPVESNVAKLELLTNGVVRVTGTAGAGGTIITFTPTWNTNSNTLTWRCTATPVEYAPATCQ